MRKAGERRRAGRTLSGVDGWDFGDALDLDAVFPDDAGGRVHGGECAGGTRGTFNVEEGDALAVGRECGITDVAVELGQALGPIAVQMRKIKIVLPAQIGAIGKEDQRSRVGRPRGI